MEPTVFSTWVIEYNLVLVPGLLSTTGLVPGLWSTTGLVPLLLSTAGLVFGLLSTTV